MKTVTVLAAIGLLFLIGCAGAPKPVEQNDINLLATEIQSLGQEVDPSEAARAADIAYHYSRQLAAEYNVTNLPIVHNALVNNGLRERGICVHYADDIEARLNAENFQTLEIHRAIAEGNEFSIDHSVPIISKRGDALEEGVVLDAWRGGGELFWSPTPDDPRYFWEPRQRVLERKYQAKLTPNPLPFSD